ncbi:MAG: N-acetylmuramoyl-L-alanine amidase-like domain-containing protein, partial [Planctomycetota bacterium]
MPRIIPTLLLALIPTACFAFEPMTPEEVDTFVAELQAEHAELRDRVLVAAHRQLGQPYDIYLLGEFPFEIDDPQPLFQLEESDCVVFVEHTYAMALSRNWAEFFAYLQRIRY